jgi:uncharacterized phage-associated protein
MPVNDLFIPRECAIIPRMSCSENFNYEKVKSVVLYLVENYPNITTTRLQKLFYLAELRSIEKNGKRISDAKYCSYRYGPYSPDVSAVADGLIDKEITRKEFMRENHRGKSYRLNTKSVKFNLEPSEMRILDEILSEYKYKKNESILKEVYESEPFVWAAFNEDLDFNAYKKECKLLYHNDRIKERVEANRKNKGTTYRSVEDLIRGLD